MYRSSTGGLWISLFQAWVFPFLHARVKDAINKAIVTRTHQLPPLVTSRAEKPLKIPP